MNEETGYRGEMIESIKTLHDKLDAIQLKQGVAQSTIEGINRRLDLLNGSVAKHSDKITEIEKANIQLANSANNANILVSALQKDMMDEQTRGEKLQENMSDFSTIKKIVFGFAGMILLAFAGTLIAYFVRATP